MKLFQILPHLLEAAAPQAPNFMPEPQVAVPESVDSVEQIEQTVKKVHEYNVKRFDDILRRSIEINDGLKPIVDRNGRWHAPKDGYRDPDTDRIYNGGAYLRFPEEYYIGDDGELKFRGGKYTSGAGWRYSDRVKMPVENAESLIQSMQQMAVSGGGKYDGYFEVSAGKSWEQNGANICYAYVKSAYKPIYDAILKYAQSQKYQPGVNAPAIPDWQEGRIIIKGKVVSIKSQYTDFGTVYKMLVSSEDGNKAYGSVPSGLDVAAGDMVEFVATVVKKEPGFYIFSRPAKAKKL